MDERDRARSASCAPGSAGAPANRLRIKQFSAIITTSGYALLAGGGWEPLINGKHLGAARALALVFGVAMLALSIYLQPLTEKPDE